MKHALLVAAMVVGLSDVAFGQGTNIHSCYGTSGSHFVLDANTQVFNYEATISAGTLAYVATLEVFHNGILKSISAQTVLLPQGSNPFNAAVNMSSWGLRAGDQVTFRLKVVGVVFGNLIAAHTAIGDVVSPTGKTE